MDRIHVNNRLVLSGSLIIKDGKILLLFRDKWQHYENPGGKVHPNDCSNPENPEVEGLRKAAVREAFEEVGDLEFDEFKYVGTVDFTIPDGRSATKHFFMTSIVSGDPKVMEPELFDRLE